MRYQRGTFLLARRQSLSAQLLEQVMQDLGIDEGLVAQHDGGGDLLKVGRFNVAEESIAV